MSVRKISELPYINFSDENIIENLFMSKMEISYCERTDSPYIFVSKHIRCDDLIRILSTYITGDVGTDSSSTTIFHNTTQFMNPVYMTNGAELSGNFYINKGVDQSLLPNYETILKTGNTTIYSVQSNKFIANSNTISGDLYINSKDTGEQIFSATAGNLTFNKLTQFNETASFNKPVEIKNTLSVTGTATFTEVINGTALRAKWADIAEFYESDSNYEPGTLIQFGGDKEITIATTEANGIVTFKPGVELNNNHESNKKMVGIALVGRTPVKVSGKVAKFDKIVLSKTISGVGVVKTDNSQVVGIALENKESDGIGLVECAVKITF